MPKKETSDPVQMSLASTPCKNCFFADYEDGVQTGCFADNRIDKFKAAGIEIIEAFDEEKKFFVIKDKVCLYYRHKESIEPGVLHKGSQSEMFRQIKSTLKIPYQIILFFRKENTLEEIRKRITEISNQEIKPRILTVIDRSHTVEDRSAEIMKLIHKDFSFDHWKVHTVQAIDIHDYEAIDICYDTTKNIKYFFYTIFETSRSIPLEFSTEIHESINEKMQSFVVLNPTGGDSERPSAAPDDRPVGKTVLKAAHQKYAGHSFGIDIKDKIVHYDDSVHLIKNVEDLCPSLRAS